MTTLTYYIKRQEQMFGPLSQLEMQELLKSGQIEANTSVSTDGKSWRPAEQTFPSIQFTNPEISPEDCEPYSYLPKFVPRFIREFHADKTDILSIQGGIGCLVFVIILAVANQFRLFILRGLTSLFAN
ncbi:DUF4339 domain-containing protein [Rubinisphaera italica]|uniref:GYF domain-containing protein n=1 Tax=Rubinisphaera italica TaxID=2527969 RepID=A0A5C5XCR8_9PLAN|nr:DUF4339 domain-containing protein [Rubinisphaera italica]TWT59712.1 hypothetical protein Pan54_04220 [Rubinisphaera italica]